MKGKTHLITGTLITASVLNLSTNNVSVGILMASAIGALLPDIDITNSKITHYITRNNSNNPVIQNVLKISILNIIGLITSVYVFNNFYPLLLSLFLTLLSLTPHRTLSHSFLSLVVIVGLLQLITTNKQVIFAVEVGYLVHLIEDMLNVTGVPLFYPLSLKKQRIPIVINETLEYIFTIIVSILCIIKIWII